MRKLMFPLLLVTALVCNCFSASAQAPASALDFDGIDDYVNVGSDPNLRLPNSFAIQVWISPTAAGGMIIVKDGEYGLRLNASGDLEYAIASTTAGWTWISTAIHIPTGVPTHVTLSYNAVAGSINIYIGGVSRYTLNSVGHIAYPSGVNDLNIGGNPGTFFTGKIDELRIWKRYLCEAEDRNNNACSLVVPATDLEANYTFDQGNAYDDNSTVTNLVDASGKHHDGILKNFSLIGSTSNWVFGFHYGNSCGPFEHVPVVECTGDIEMTTSGCSVFISVPPPTASDDCSAVSLNATRSDNKALTDPYLVGTTVIVTWRATNNSGGSAECSQNVFVRSSMLPTISCSAGTITISSNCEVSYTPVPPPVTTSCSQSYSLVGVRSDGHPLNDPYPVGETFITWTVTDASANMQACKVKIVVVSGSGNTSGYMIFATTEVKFGEYNFINGNVGVSAPAGKASFNKNDVLDPYSVRAKNITVQLPATVGNKIFSAATDGPTTISQVYNSNTTGLSDFTVTTNNTTLTNNYRNLTVNKGLTVTLTNNNFGNITLMEGATVKFTSSSISLKVLNLNNGGRSGITTVIFSSNASVKVGEKIVIGQSCSVNPTSQNVTFYLADVNKDVESFTVDGKSTQVIANIMIPHGNLNVKGGETNMCYMTGWYIIEKLESTGKNIVWNGNACPAANASASTAIVSDTPAEEKSTSQQRIQKLNTEETFNVSVWPNPSSYDFEIQVKSKSNESIAVQVLDATGRIVEQVSGNDLKQTVRFGTKLNPGTYFAGIAQGVNHKVIKVLKIK